MTKPTKTRLNQIYDAPSHRRSKRLGANLSADLRAQYGTRSMRVILGDSVKVMRGEYNGIEGKVTKVFTERGKIAIEGIQREKVGGGNVPIMIDASKVMIVALNTGDKWRQSMLDRRRKGE